MHLIDAPGQWRPGIVLNAKNQRLGLGNGRNEDHPAIWWIRHIPWYRQTQVTSYPSHYHTWSRLPCLLCSLCFLTQQHSRLSNCIPNGAFRFVIVLFLTYWNFCAQQNSNRQPPQKTLPRLAAKCSYAPVQLCLLNNVIRSLNLLFAA